MIDPEKGQNAIKVLKGKGLIDDGTVKALEGILSTGLPFSDLIIRELGSEIAGRYLAEEFLEHLTIYEERLELDKITVPELLLKESPERQPWHTRARFLIGSDNWIREEATEPWHPSLRKKYLPLPALAMWFNHHPPYHEFAVKILVSVHQVKPPQPSARFPKGPIGGTR